jgi:hypothetical protein
MSSFDHMLRILSSPDRVSSLQSREDSHGNTEAKLVTDARHFSPTKKSTASSREVFRLKVIFSDGGVTIDVASNQTMTHVMLMVCSKWLSILRNGDGSIDAHNWSVRGPPLTEHVYVQRVRCGDRRTTEWREAREKCERSKQTIPAYTKLDSIRGFDKGRSLTVVYDDNDATKFEIKLLGKYIAKPDRRFPKLVSSAADKVAKSFRLYNLPKDYPNLNDIFPYANKAMFQGGERWICPYPTSPSCGGFICGEFKRHFDVVFLPYKSSCLHEALAVIDQVMKKYPEKASECTSRLALPVKVSPPREAKFHAYTQEPGCERRINDLIPNKKFTEILSKYNTVVSRITERQLLEYHNVVDPIFPLSSRIYGKGRWASYRNRKVIIGEGNDMGGEERGVLMKIYAEVSYSVRSLHEFFCVCESLIRRTEENELKGLDRHLASLRI